MTVQLWLGRKDLKDLKDHVDEEDSREAMEIKDHEVKQQLATGYTFSYLITTCSQDHKEILA